MEKVKTPYQSSWFNERSLVIITVVQSLSCIWLFVTPWIAAHQVSQSFTISQSLLKHMSTESVMPSSHLIRSCPLLLPSAFPSIRVFSSESALRIRWPKYWSLGIRPSNEYSGLISFRIDWFDPLGVQGTLKSVLQIIIVKGILRHPFNFRILYSSSYKLVSLRGRGHMYSYGWFMLSYDRNQHNIVKQLSSN